MNAGYRRFEEPDIEGTGATLLAESIGSTWDLPTFVRVAGGIAAALGRLHAHGLVHRDIRPANIFVRPADGQAWLAGLGMAARLPRSRLSPVLPEVVAGTLPYMSPEQTGRMNRSLDARSDLYSLGITLHEMATGSLPFNADTAMEWIHCHMAREPASASGILPPPLDAIIRKLLAKNAEDRYQTAAGLTADLERCLEALLVDGRIDPFQLGASDASERLLVPDKLYGRDREIAVIRAAFERVATSANPELVLVSGYSGIGKSSVVNELHKLVVPNNGLFATGKFDQHRRDIPYSPIAQAFRGLLREILGKSDTELEAWRELLTSALGQNGQLLLELLPELELVIGEQPVVPELPPQEAKTRFRRTLRSLLSSFASKQGVLALFLDDLQWLDAATLELLESLFTGELVHKLLLIGAYRDNEVGPLHPLTAVLSRIRESGVAVSEVELTPLATTDTEQLVADALRAEPESVGPLARLIQDKSGGNPFFAIQFLTGLVDGGFVTYDRGQARWAWDSDRVSAKSFTDNVVQLMVGKLERLPAPTQAALRDLACLGNASPIRVLSVVVGKDLDAAMGEAVQAGLVFGTDDEYGFLHDRVQEAAYALIAEGQRPIEHLRIARLLTERLEPAQREQAIFDIVNQYNRATARIESIEERTTVARLNLVAGRRSRATSAYGSAETYFASGRAQLGEDPWEAEHDLAFGLELGRAECELFIGARESMEERLSLLRSRCRDSIERAAVTCLRMEMLGSVHRNDLKIECGLEYLRSVGIDWSAQPSSEDVARSLESLWQDLGTRSVSDLLDLPRMTDAASCATMNVLAPLLGSVYANSPSLLVLCVVYMTRLSIEQGNSDASAQAYNFLAIIMVSRNERPQDGYRFGQLAVNLVEQRGLDRFRAGTWVVFAMGILPWTQHLANSREALRRAIQAGIANGDISYAAYGGYLSVAARLGAGDPLEDVEREAEDACRFAQNAGYTVGVDFITTRLSLIQTLRGLTPRFGWLAQEEEREARFEAKLDKSLLDPVHNVLWIRLGKLQARFLAGELADALDAAAKARDLLWSIPERFDRAEFHFYSALAHAGADRVEVVREHHAELCRWAVDCPENFGCRAATVAAELARLEGRELAAERLYEEALRLARQHRFVQVEALAAELAAQFHRARGLETIADAYLATAREAYGRWGAQGKVRQLDERFPRLRFAGPSAQSVELRAGELDLATVVQVSQTVSAEIVLGTLLEKILTVAIENAGAERGTLLLPRDGELQIEARAAASGAGVEVIRSATAVIPSELPASILRYVARTREPVILGDAILERGPFSSDEYLHRTRVRSLLCLPLVKQARLIGVLYLENNFSPDVFTPRRVALLDLLTSQAAISLENARLHTELQTAQDGLRLALRENGLMIDAIPAQAWYSGPDGAGERFNKPWLEYAGLSHEQAIGWGWSAILHPEDTAKIQHRWQEIRETGAAAELELRQRRHDGVYRWFLVHVRPLKDESGKILRFYGTNLDIDDLKQAQEDLRRNEAFLAEGQRVSATGSFLWRLETDELACSDELYRIFGFEQGTPVSIERIMERVFPDDRPLVTQKVELARTGTIDHEYEVRLRMPDGSLKYIQTSSHPNQDQQGKRELIGVLQDVTERRRAEETLSMVRSELANMTRVASLGVLSASITHEVNQPLSGILINSGACLRMLSATPPDVNGALETVRRTLRDGKRAGDVISRLRALFTNKDTTSDPLDLNEATREVLALSLSELHRNRVVLRSELADQLPQVIGDRIQLQQVILNLVHNASQAMTGIDDRRRDLIVRTEREGHERVRLTVRDVGVGIPTDGIEKLFEPFHTTKTTGMGIGLAVSRSIVEKHGGRLQAVPNTDGPGTTFSFSIPLSANQH